MRFYSPTLLSVCAVFLSLNASAQGLISFLTESTTGAHATGGGGAPIIDFNLEVEVVMDTVLYEGFEEVPEGFRRYKLYAVIPDGALMLGPAADDVSVPAIPGFGYNADCGCYNFTSPAFAADGYNNAATINPAFYATAPELLYDTWWTTHVSDSTAGITVIEFPFQSAFNSCSDQVVQGGLLVTPNSPVHGTVQNDRALIGQITTCETFEFQVCVAFSPGLGGEIFTSCTDGEVVVPDFCAAIHGATLDVQGGDVSIIAETWTASTRCRLYTSSGEWLEEQYGGGASKT